MKGKFKDNKIIYVTPIYNFLTGGNWKDGWSGSGRSGGEIIEYDVVSNSDLENDKRYEFEIIDGKAQVKIPD